MNSIFDRIQGDRMIWLITMFFSLISIPLIFLSTKELAHAFKNGNDYYFVLKHAVTLFISLVLIYYVHLTNHRYISKLSILLICTAIPLLLLTLMTGQSTNSAVRWLKIPVIGLSFQTSDFAKLALITYLARVLSKKQDILDDLKQVTIHIFTPVLIVCALTIKQDFSTTLLILGTCVLIMYFGNVKYQHILIVFGGLGVLFFVFAKAFPDLFPRLETWISRISQYLATLFDGAEAKVEDTEGNYQSNLAKAAIIDGGLTGTYFNGGKYPNPPQAASDFVFASLVRNYGLIGGIITLLLYVLFLFRSIKIAVKASKTFSSLLVIGLSFGIIFQAFSNMAVAVGLFPVTGQPLPMISMGGTSIWFTGLSIGIILSVSRANQEEAKKGKLANQKAYSGTSKFK